MWGDVLKKFFRKISPTHTTHNRYNITFTPHNTTYIKHTI